MQTHAPPIRLLVTLSAFALVCITLTLLAYISFGGSVPFAPTGYEFKLPLSNAENLVPGSDVEMAGVKIGKVLEVQRDGNHAMATVDIKPQYAPMRSGVLAILRTKSLLGEAYLELAPGPQNAPRLDDGATLPASHVKPDVTLDQFLSAFNPSVRAQFRNLYAGLNQALSGQDESFNDSLGRLAPVSGNLTAVLSTLNGETGQLQHLFSSSGQVFSALGQTEGDLQAVVTAGNAVFRTTADQNRSIESIVRALPPFLRQLHSTSAVIATVTPSLGAAAAALNTLSPTVAPALSVLNRNLPAFHELFQRLPAAISDGRAGLPALTQILKTIPTAFSQLYPTSRQLIPVFQLFATYAEPGLVAPLANAADAVNGTLVGPEGKIISRASGAVFLSNETIGGWVKRLPTNRSNPYPTPTALQELGKQGFLDSYDCRNVDNIEYLPPTGTGVPPCVTQGPWDYRGKVAYYPRLYPASP